MVVLDKLTYAGNLANLAPVAEDHRLRFVEGDILDRLSSRSSSPASTRSCTSPRSPTSTGRSSAPPTS